MIVPFALMGVKPIIKALKNGLFRHVLVNNFKFGVVYQRVGQTTEEALFGNR